jgi:AraC-like DNA-binding protein
LNESAILRPVIQSVRERRPASALARHVTCVWVQEVSRDSAPFVHRRAPNGSAEVVCVLGSLPRVLGPQTGPLVQPLAPGTTVVGVRLRPGAAPPVLHLPASETTDLDLGADELWGSRAAALGEALASAGSPQRAQALLEQAVADRLADGPNLDPVATEAVRRLVPARPTGLDALASALYISERQLRRRCEAAVGLAPKALHRILRFQRFIALAWTLEQPSAQLARLAADAGYADQAHLTREAQRLEGRSPRTLLQESEQRCGCGHDHAASYGPLLRASALN